MNKNIFTGSLILVFFCVGGLTGYLITDLTSEDYDALLLDFQELDEAYNRLLEDYTALQENHTELQTKYDILFEDNVTTTDTYNELLNDYTLLNSSYYDLLTNFENLQIDYDTLSLAYDQLTVLYSQLEEEYLLLEIAYNLLSQQWDQLSTWIRGMVLPAQYLVFTEAVRRYYFEDYYIQDTWSTGNVSGYWAEFARFCRDIILHDSQIDDSLYGSWFPEVSNAMTDCLKYGNQTEELAFNIFYYTFWDWIPNWAGWGLTGNALSDISTIVDWCIAEVDYEYDTAITVGQEPFGSDYVKFPVETAFRTLGDCEDQAMLCAAYLESCGFETALGIFHDAENPEFPDGFYHGSLLVKIYDTNAFWNRHPFGVLWTFDEGITYWCWIDTTWDVSFGSKPAWMPYYISNGITYSDVTIAICDLDGLITL